MSANIDAQVEPYPTIYQVQYAAPAERMEADCKDLCYLASTYADDQDVFKPGPTFSFQKR